MFAERGSTKSEIEEGMAARAGTLGGLDLGFERSERASSEAPSLGAMAYASGANHLLGPSAGLGPSADLVSHEASHVVQQARGRLFAGQY